jgi:tetratricopeptide (TPR) repeat protein
MINRNGNRPLLFWLAILIILLLRPSFSYPEEVIVRSQAQFDYGRACIAEGQYEKAVYELQRFIHLFPQDPLIPNAHFLIGTCHLKMQRFDEARQAFQGILDSAADEEIKGRALLLIGESYSIQGVFDEAGHCLTQVIQQYPHVELKNVALYRLGWTEMRGGRWREASGYFKQVEEDSPLYAGARQLAEQSLLGEDLPRKNPRCAGGLAALVPGLGHAYVSRYRDAAVAFIVNGLFIWAAAESFQEDHEVLGGILTAFELGWYTGNIYSAVNCAHKHNRKVEDDFRKGLTDQFDLQIFGADRGRVGVALTFRF